MAGWEATCKSRSWSFSCAQPLLDNVQGDPFACGDPQKIAHAIRNLAHAIRRRTGLPITTATPTRFALLCKWPGKALLSSGLAPPSQHHPTFARGPTSRAGWWWYRGQEKSSGCDNTQADTSEWCETDGCVAGQLVHNSCWPIAGCQRRSVATRKRSLTAHHWEKGLQAS